MITPYENPSTANLASDRNITDRGAITVDDFCKWCSIGRSKFYQEVQEGRIKLRKIGRKSVVLVDDATDWLANLPQSKGDQP